MKLWKIIYRDYNNVLYFKLVEALDLQQAIYNSVISQDRLVSVSEEPEKV